MKFLFDGKFWLIFDDGLQYEVTEMVWIKLMARAKKELSL